MNEPSLAYTRDPKYSFESLYGERIYDVRHLIQAASSLSLVDIQTLKDGKVNNPNSDFDIKVFTHPEEQKLSVGLCCRGTEDLYPWPSCAQSPIVLMVEGHPERVVGYPNSQTGTIDFFLPAGSEGKEKHFRPSFVKNQILQTVGKDRNGKPKLVTIDLSSEDALPFSQLERGLEFNLYSPESNSDVNRCLNVRTMRGIGVPREDPASLVRSSNWNEIAVVDVQEAHGTKTYIAVFSWLALPVQNFLLRNVATLDFDRTSQGDTTVYRINSPLNARQLISLLQSTVYSGTGDNKSTSPFEEALQNKKPYTALYSLLKHNTMELDGLVGEGTHHSVDDNLHILLVKCPGYIDVHLKRTSPSKNGDQITKESWRVLEDEQVFRLYEDGTSASTTNIFDPISILANRTVGRLNR